MSEMIKEAEAPGCSLSSRVKLPLLGEGTIRMSGDHLLSVKDAMRQGMAIASDL